MRMVVGIDPSLVILAAALIVLGVIAWIEPWIAIAFLVNGSVVYYATLDVLGVAPSGALTGLVLAVPGLTALARLALRRRAARTLMRSVFLVLFVAFTVIWFTRWMMEPPASTIFGSRALAYMVVLACVPFIAGHATIGAENIRIAFRWLLAFGAVDILIVLVYWLAGAPTLNQGGSGRWEPIPYLSGGLIAVDLGITLLSFLVLFEKPNIRYALAAPALAALVLAVDVRIASRGPFVALLVALATYVGILAVRAGLRRALMMAIGFAAAFVLAYAASAPSAERTIEVTITPSAVPTAESGAAVSRAPSPAGSPTGPPDGSAPPIGPSPPLSTPAVTAAPTVTVVTRVAPPRVAGSEEYFSPTEPATREHIENLVAAAAFIRERPLFGWGGALVGRDIQGHPWDYSHTIFLDPLVETGLVGALPFWTLFALAIYGFWRTIRKPSPAATLALAILPPLVFVFLTTLVSGHVSNSRHFWLMAGLTCGFLVETEVVAYPAAVARLIARAMPASVRVGERSSPRPTPTKPH